MRPDVGEFLSCFHHHHHIAQQIKIVESRRFLVQLVAQNQNKVTSWLSWHLAIMVKDSVACIGGHIFALWPWAYCFFPISIAPVAPGFFARQASEQYLTSAQVLAQRLRQVISRPQKTQILLGSDALLPLNPVEAMLRNAAASRGCCGSSACRCGNSRAATPSGHPCRCRRCARHSATAFLAPLSIAPQDRR